MTILILRLSSSRDTAASSTHRVLADLALSALPDAEVDFAFLPPKGNPRITGLFSGRDGAAFDLILVVNSFVQEALNLPWLLHANGQAAWAPERPETFPPIVLGGSNAFAAQCLVRQNGEAVPDAMFFGEAEESLPTFVRRWANTQGSKPERLRQAAEGLDGFWVTGTLPDVPVRQASFRSPATQASLQPLPDVETAGTVRIAVSAGCAAFCSFCFEGYERKPYREFSVSDVLLMARRLKASCGASVAELDAFNLNTFKDLAPLIETCVRIFDRVAFKSQRADGIAACPELIDLEHAAGKGSFTLGIEGISPRMRSFLCKSLSDADLLLALKALFDRRVRELKLFFILTAHETPEDLAAFADLCQRIKGWQGAPGSCTRVVLSFGRLVRMPNTPLAFDRLFLRESDWRFCVDGIAAVCRRAQLEYRFAFDWPDYLGTQLLAACGHGHADAVVALACQGLSCHGPWNEREAAALRSAVPLENAATVEGAPPFSFVSKTVSSEHLAKRWEEAKRFVDSGYCLGQACSACGACSDTAERQLIVQHPRSLSIPAGTIERVADIEARKRRLVPVYLSVSLPDEFAGRSPEWASARLMQIVLTQHPEWIDNLLSIEECLFSKGENEETLVLPAGETVIAIRAWETAALPAGLASSSPIFNASPLPQAFVPCNFVKADWQLHAAVEPRKAAEAASAWLNGQRLPHTLRREGESWRLDLAAASLKKKSVFSLSAEAFGDGSRLAVAFAPKANIRDLLHRLPPLRGHPSARCIDIQFR